MKKRKNGSPGRSPDKKKAPQVAGPEGAFNNHSLGKTNRQSVQANDTTYPLKVNHATPVDGSRRQNLATRPLPELRRWTMIETFKRNLSNAITIQPALFDLNGPLPVTTQQINYLVKLYHRAGRKKFAQIKIDLGITRKVPNLTRHEASLLIKTLRNADFA